ncbi:glyoxylase-like metal-dependent hydrolase (beta-lactamase superfamily II) [Nakamurella sp. UYEF19]|uniref:MBL fold metallo-hydrolase n=1 Tax=Nakamurella sp. UYEF19 TaxID=1756392 RepID=UPI00339B0D56
MYAPSDPDPYRSTPAARPLDVNWIHGSPEPKYNDDPDIQVYLFDENTVILRQNVAVSFEAPFMFLLFGESRAVLLDTGATESAQYFPLRRTVDGLVDEWLAEHPSVERYPLLVLHTHSHGDHTAGDAQFADRADTRVVNALLENAFPYFGFDEAPDAVIPLDLGGRVLEALANPGHHKAAITFYDTATGILFTGDTVYPGRLYVFDWDAFDRTIDRLIDFCAERPISHVIGCHIEMSTSAGQDYPMGFSFHPDEHPLELTVAHLHHIRATLDENGRRAGRYVLPELIITAMDPPA